MPEQEKNSPLYASDISRQLADQFSLKEFLLYPPRLFARTFRKHPQIIGGVLTLTSMVIAAEWNRGAKSSGIEDLQANPRQNTSDTLLPGQREIIFKVEVPVIEVPLIPASLTPNPTETRVPTITATATAESTATKTATPEAPASPTTAPTIALTKEPTVSPTEVPKRPNWTEEQIIKAQQEATENGSPLLLDTWSEKGAKAVEARTPGQTDALAFNGFKEGDTFDSPEAGKVEYLTVEVLRGNFKFRSVVIRTKSDILALWIGFNDKILVKEGQEFELNQPLVELSGDFLPSDLRMMKYGQPYKSQICLVVNRTDGHIYLKNILTDNGLPVQLAPKGGK